MGFKMNHEQAFQSDGIKPEGDYECIITAIEERTTKSGATGLNVTMVIRNDVQGQKYGNACLFHTLWKRKEPSEFDMQVNGYSFGQVMALGKAAGLPDGKDYDSLAQMCGDLVKKCVRVTLKHEEYNGKTQERVSYLNPTQFPNCQHKFKQAAATNDSFAKPPQQTSFANTNNQRVSTFEDFEEVLSDDGCPF